MFEGVESEQNHRVMETVVEILGRVAERFEQTQEPDRQGSSLAMLLTSYSSFSKLQPPPAHGFLSCNV